MPTYDLVHCDVFTDRPFGGNPLAVFPDARGIDDATMQRIAGELNLSETVFVLPPDDERALRRLRIFTPGRELPLAGHPVVGAWHVLAAEGLVPLPAGGTGSTRIHQQLAVGVLPVDIAFEGGAPAGVTMTQPTPAISDPLDTSGIALDGSPLDAAAPRTDPLDAGALAARALGLEPGAIASDRIFPVVTISAGSPFVAVMLTSRAALASGHPDRAALDALIDPFDAHGIYAFYRESAALVHARMFGGTKLNITEDPATGGAAGPLAGALARFGWLSSDAPRFVIEQGADMGRPSTIAVEAVYSGAEIEAVRVAGRSVILMRATMTW